ncbi:MAG: hypothetical protein QOF48_2936 [Verrucomicrobiota bacterium]|jgi:hypothetical protein
MDLQLREKRKNEEKTFQVVTHVHRAIRRCREPVRS